MATPLRRFFTANYNILLMLLFLLFVSRPYEYNEIYVGIWKTFLTVTLIVAIFNCNHPQTTKMVISILAIPTLIFSWLALAHQTIPVLITTGILTALFMLICACSILYHVVLGARVTIETLRGVICAYFLVAFIFAYIYLLMEYISPNTFLIRGEALPILPQTRFFSEMLYFSFVTLLTVGFGDIVAIKEWGQTVVVIEGIVGQFYIAILVARLVSVYSLLTDKLLLRHLEKDLK